MKFIKPAVVIAELEALTDTVYLGKGTPDLTQSKFIEMFDFVEILKTLETTVPVWTGLLHWLMRDPRYVYKGSRSKKSGRDGRKKGDGDGEAARDENGRNTEARRMFFITSVFCHTRSQVKSSRLSKAMGWYLLHCRVKPRTIDVFASLGICDHYKYIRRDMAAAAAAAAAAGMDVQNGTDTHTDVQTEPQMESQRK